MTPAVRIRDLRYRYRGTDRDVLRMGTLDVEGPGVVAVVGQSGVGKTTLMELLAGTLREPYHGSMQVLGVELRDLRRDADRQRHLRRVGLIPQDFGLLPGTSVRDILLQDLADAQVPVPEHEARVGQALGRVGLLPFAARDSDQLSGGQRQRVAIARTLARNVDLIIADEPTANLDPAQAESITALFQELGAGRPVLIVTHDMGLAARCARTIVLRPLVEHGQSSEWPRRRGVETAVRRRHGVGAVRGMLVLAIAAVGCTLAVRTTNAYQTTPSQAVAQLPTAGVPRSRPSRPVSQPPAPAPAAPPGATSTPALSSASIAEDANRQVGRTILPGGAGFAAAYLASIWFWRRIHRRPALTGPARPGFAGASGGGDPMATRLRRARERPSPRADVGDETASLPDGVLSCTERGCAAQTGGSACSYRDRRGRQCATAWCLQHREVIDGRVYCRRHAGIMEVATTSRAALPLPDLENRAASLVGWVGRDLDPAMRAMLDNSQSDYRLLVLPAHSTYVGFKRARAWEWSWRLVSSTQIAATVAIHVEECKDDEVVVSVCSWVAARLTPPWIEQRRRGVAPTPTEDAAIRAAFYRSVVGIVVGAFRELQQRGLVEGFGVPVPSAPLF